MKTEVLCASESPAAQSRCAKIPTSGKIDAKDSAEQDKHFNNDRFIVWQTLRVSSFREKNK